MMKTRRRGRGEDERAERKGRRTREGKTTHGRVSLLDPRHLLLQPIFEGLKDMLHRAKIRSPLVRRQTLLLGQERSEQLDVRSLRISVDHPLEADILVKPDGPRGAGFGIAEKKEGR